MRCSHCGLLGRADLTLSTTARTFRDVCVPCFNALIDSVFPFPPEVLKSGVYYVEGENSPELRDVLLGLRDTRVLSKKGKVA